MTRNWQTSTPPGGGGGFGPLAFPALTSVTRALLWANGIAFALSFFLVRALPSVGEPLIVGGRGAPDLGGSGSILGLSPALWREWLPFVPLWQLVSYGFLHDLRDITHLLYNMLALYFFGTMVEGIVGGRRFAWLYFAGIVVGGAAQLAAGFIALANGHPAPTTYGASGAVMCIVVAAAMLQPHARVIFIFFPMTLRTLALLMVGIDVFRMLSGDSHVAWLVHLTGAALGYLAVARHWIWIDPVQVLAKARSDRHAQSERDDAARLDQLLERIQREGMSSLSEREKSFLKRVSSRRRV